MNTKPKAKSLSAQILIDPTEIANQQDPIEYCPCSICFDRVTINYKGHPKALNNLSFSMPKGAHLAVMGVSGSGKSTFLGCIAGALNSSTGKITVHGKVATIHQELHLVKQHTALTNVLHGAVGRYSFLRTLFGFPKTERDKAINFLKRVGLEHKQNIPVCRLSGGEKQRVAIARALMQEPDIILADEPVAALDEINAHSIMRLINDIARERNLTVVSVLHDSVIARVYADHFIQLENGEIIKSVSLSEEIETPELLQSLCSDKDLDTDPEKEKEQVIAKDRISKRRWAWYALSTIICIWAFTGVLKRFDLDSVGLYGLVTFLGQIFPSSIDELYSIPWGTLAYSLIETIQMACVGTVLGIVFSWPLAALSARNIGPSWVRRPIRVMLNGVRTVPSILWALLFVAAVGLGTVAGILALTAYSVGYLSKFFYEAFEGVEPGTPRALKEIGANGLQRFFHAIWPAAKPAILSSSLFMLEYNVRAASVLGVVDAGGIGFYIKQYVDFRFFPAVTASLTMLLVLVLILDYLSSWVRTKLLEDL